MTVHIGDFLTAEEIASVLGLSVKTVYNRAWREGWLRMETVPVRYFAPDVVFGGQQRLTTPVTCM
jgi:hypothetical protein